LIPKEKENNNDNKYPAESESIIDDNDNPCRIDLVGTKNFAININIESIAFIDENIIIFTEKNEESNIKELKEVNNNGFRPICMILCAASIEKNNSNHHILLLSLALEK